MLAEAESAGTKVLLPTDHVVAAEFSKDAEASEQEWNHTVLSHIRCFALLIAYVVWRSIKQDVRELVVRIIRRSKIWKKVKIMEIYGKMKIENIRKNMKTMKNMKIMGNYGTTEIEQIWTNMENTEHIEKYEKSIGNYGKMRLVKYGKIWNIWTNMKTMEKYEIGGPGNIILLIKVFTNPSLGYAKY